MYKLGLKLKIMFLIPVFIAFCLFLPNFSCAQSTPQFLISWEAKNYVPDWYSGKILPTAKTNVEISFELIDNGKPVDLSGVKVRWYINDKLVKNENNGLGIKKINFITPNYFNQEAEIRIAVVDYANVGFIDKLIDIPVVRPEAVINAPYADNKIKTGGSIFELFLFFFTTNNKENFSIQWSVLDKKPKSQKDDPFKLDLNVDSQIPVDSVINLSVVVNNIVKTLESAVKIINLTVK